MSRTRHLTRAEADNNTRPTRRHAQTRLTKLGGWAHPNEDRPKNAGNRWRYGYDRGRRHRKHVRLNKVIGRRIDRRRLNREVP